MYEAPHSSRVEKRWWKGFSAMVELGIGVTGYTHWSAFIETEMAQYPSEVHCLMDENVSTGLEAKDVKPNIEVSV